MSQASEVPVPVAMWAQQISAHWSQRKRVSPEQAGPTSVGSSARPPLYENQLSHLRLQQGALFLAFCAGRGRTCPHAGSNTVRHSESLQDTRRDGKEIGTFSGTLGGNFPGSVSPYATPLPPPLILFSNSQLWGRAKTTSNSRRQTDVGVPTLRGWRPETQSRAVYQLF